MMQKKQAALEINPPLTQTRKQTSFPEIDPSPRSEYGPRGCEDSFTHTPPFARIRHWMLEEGREGYGLGVQERDALVGESRKRENLFEI